MIYGSMRHDYNGRKIKRKKARGVVYGKYTPPPFKPITSTTGSSFADIRLAEARQYQSVSVTVSDGICAKQDKSQYTGSLVKGVGVMHKSNLVPITSQEDAKELARMRR